MIRWCLLAVLLLSSPARAATIAGVDIPETYRVDGRVLQLNGAVLRSVTILSVRVYVAALYVSQPSHDADAILAEPGPKVVVMHFLHEATKAQIAAEFRKGEQRQCGDGTCTRADLPDFDRLIAASPSISVGDVLTYIYAPDRIQAFFNGQGYADLPNADLSRQLLLAWIGPHAPSEALRKGLLDLP